VEFDNLIWSSESNLPKEIEKKLDNKFSSLTLLEIARPVELAENYSRAKYVKPCKGE